jgi:hypothetical protein
MVNSKERDYDEYSHYALRYSMISTGVADYGRSLPRKPKKKDLSFFYNFRESGYARFRTIMTRASEMSDRDFEQSLEFFKITCLKFDERVSKTPL